MADELPTVAYAEAVLQNDAAQQKCYADMGGNGHHEDRQERLRDIGKEAKMWLRHLDVIHGRV